MVDNLMQKCNEKCKVKYEKLDADELIKKILEVQKQKKVAFNDCHTEDRLRDSYFKNGLLSELCIIECGVIEQGW